MPKISAGLLMFRRCAGTIQVLLVHPGGPFFRNKDEGSWSIPKGEPQAGEELLAAGIREFQEETSFVPKGPYMELSPVKQKGGKVVHAWAFENDCDLAEFKSNTFEVEWPPRSGRMAAFPEADTADFFDLETASKKINAAQAGLLNELERRMSAG